MKLIRSKIFALLFAKKIQFDRIENEKKKKGFSCSAIHTTTTICNEDKEKCHISGNSSGKGYVESSQNFDAY